MRNKLSADLLLSQRQTEIITGWLLGDGSLKKPKTDHQNSSFSLGQSKYPRNKPERTEAITWTHNELEPFSSNLYEKERIDRRDNALIESLIRIETYTSAHPIFTKMYHKWYKPKKIVSRDIKLTPLIIAIWAIIEIAEQFEKEFGISVCHSSISNVLNKIDAIITRYTKDIRENKHLLKCRKRQ